MSDNKFINPETLLQYCNTNEAFLEKKVRGIVLEFPGLGGGSCLGGLMDLMSYDTPFTRQFADAGLVVAYTFPGPWSWMNKGAVRMADLIVDALREKYQLSEDSPLIATGGSMGGLGALIYTASSRHKVTACAAACPCYDLTTCYDVVPHFARTVVSAVSTYDMPLEEAIKTISPLYRLDDMPSIPYFIVCDEADDLFPADGMHDYVKKLEEATESQVIYHRLPGQPHGGFTPEVRQALNDFVIACAN
ncbi:MAG: hypothetical protein E7618_06825 [Ruminococcaceae bacterium]|nr:hypothetical protein [Oscillospiraceae bacterium]